MEFMEIINTGKSVLTGNYITAGMAVATFALPNKVVYGAGKTVGAALSTLLRQKSGSTGERVEKYFQGSINALVSGLNDGMDEDDE
jgi:NADP-dependent 3-hydroxy acid dehydrogenase YdfG|tara:strand:+ start:123 stop:380 length:258 start_codon:yes stop_codon:yes gene_type:complete